MDALHAAMARKEQEYEKRLAETSNHVESMTKLFQERINDLMMKQDKAFANARAEERMKHQQGSAPGSTRVESIPEGNAPSGAGDALPERP